MNMWFPQFAIFIWCLCALTLDSDAFKCPKGQRVEVKKRGALACSTCPEDQYQSEENASQNCSPCTKCHKGKGSEEEEKCNSVRNRKCKCRENFVPYNSDSTSCKCASGFTLQSEECVKVEEKPHKATTSIHVPLLTVPTSPRPQERTPTQKPVHNITITPDTKTTTTTTTTTVTATTKEKKSSLGSSIVVGLICLMVILLALTALLCRRNVLARVKREPEQAREASFRVPVEESGDGSQDPLKQNQEEP